MTEAPKFDTVGQVARHVAAFRKREFRVLFYVARTRGVKAAFAVAVDPYGLG